MQNSQQNKLTYSKDAWHNVYQRSLKDGIAEFICETVKYLPRGVRHNSIINKFRKFAYKLAGLKIGKRSFIYNGVTIICPHNITIGDDSFINYGCLMSAYSKIEINNRITIAYNCSLITESHNPYSPDFEAIIKPIIIKDNVWIGANSVILQGVVIEEGSIIAAGSIVNSNVEPYSIYAGAPAKKIKERLIK